MKNKYLLRVISGKYRGKGISSPKDFSVRPTSQRVKESLFNIIRTDLYGKIFLDIFSGTGQIGIEAISNGAKAYFVDGNVALLKSNLESVGCLNEAEVFCGDFINVLKSIKNIKFDFIFADPPYKDELYQDIVKYSIPILNKDGVIILEHSSDIVFDSFDDAVIVDKRIYGSRALTFLGGKNENNGLSGQL